MKILKERQTEHLYDIFYLFLGIKNDKYRYELMTIKNENCLKS